MCWSKRVKEAGGRVLRNGETQAIFHDGKQYDFQSIWNESEEIASFLETYSTEIVKSDEAMVESYLTLFFSVRE